MKAPPQPIMHIVDTVFKNLCGNKDLVESGIDRLVPL